MNCPFDEVVVQANKVIAAGGTIHQKFTCGKCGSRQTMETANTFYQSGKCEECNHLTNILTSGCNFVAILGGKK